MNLDNVNRVQLCKFLTTSTVCIVFRDFVEKCAKNPLQYF